MFNLKKLTKALFWTVLFIFISACKTGIHNIDNKKTLSELKTIDSALYEAITLYKSNVDYRWQNKGIISVYSKDISNPKSTKFIRYEMRLGSIYSRPITSFFRYKSDSILIYSKKDKFMNPRNYPSEFIKSMKKNLFDDFTLIETEEGHLKLLASINYHPKIWILKNGKQLDSLPEKIPSLVKKMYGDKWFTYFEYDNLDDIQIIKFVKEK